MNTFYLDLDGVCADFAAGAELIVGYRLHSGDDHYPAEDWNKIVIDGRIYRNLPLMPLVHQLVDTARCYRDQLGWRLLFLTAVPHANDITWAFWDKVQWAQQHFADIPVHFGPYSRDKAHHCRAGDILVDDRSDNCRRWTQAGGLAFKVDQDLGPVITALQQDFISR